ncbi:MAG: RNA 2',3'-cyclic phosphodiesterase [Verrucomicrobia bacterium]|nr:RNA 2',3'-cyclic phosphodiesterase [Verrucomicrobiota bacterium]
MSEFIRTFVAIKVSDDIAHALIDLQSKLKKQLGGVQIRWSSRHQLHITLVFLGNVAVGRIDDLSGALDRACKGIGCMDFRAAGVGAFPSKDRPRVIWAGVEGDVAALCELQRRVAAATHGFGEATEEREFHPHLTLGRLSRRSAGEEFAVARVLHSINPATIGGWRAESVFLVKSELNPSGPIYTDIAEFHLLGAE